MESSEFPLLIVSHQAVTRILYSYLSGVQPEKCCNIEIPLHTIIQLKITPYGLEEKRYDFNEKVNQIYSEKYLKSNLDKLNQEICLKDYFEKKIFYEKKHIFDMKQNICFLKRKMNRIVVQENFHS